MKPVSSLLAAMAALLFLMGLVACLHTKGSGAETGRQAPASDSGSGESEELMVNRIAYVDNSGDLLLINPDSTGEERLTGNVRAGMLSQALERGDSYYWPTWSRDGSRIAASRVSLSGRTGGVSVQLFELPSGRMVTAYDNEIPAPVADGAPHYIYWSPDDRYLSFLAPTPEGLSLLVRDYHSPTPSEREAVSIAVGAPLYYHWAADSARLAIHSGDRVTIDEPTSDGDGTRVAVDAFNFRAPALSPDGSQLAYGGIVGGVQGIYLATTADPTAPSLLMETQGMTAFAWAPDGATLAVAEQSQAGAPVFNTLRLVRADGSGSSLLVDEHLLAFFWSPQGDRIAWIGIDPLSRAMDLAVSQVEPGDSGPGESGQTAGEPRYLFRFSPTGELFTWFSFFDQYAYSHSLWAPDGSALVITGTDGPEPGRRNGSGPPGGQVFVVNSVTGDARRIASGKVAVWSWN